MSRLINVPPQLTDLEYVVGVDEVGRGCLSGPVFAAAVILPKNFTSDLIRDSKKMSEKKRLLAYDLIMDCAIDVTCSLVSANEIDRINIQEATFLAMNKSIKDLKTKPQHILVDGNAFKTDLTIPYTCVTKGDNTYLSIASASIIAKVTRDKYMCDLHNKYPEYGWSSNKGYGSKHHIKTIRKIGITPEHRTSFLKNIVPND